MLSRSRVFFVAFALGLFILGGCRGPNLRLLNAKVTEFDRASGVVGWRADLENSTEDQSLFCKRGPAEGWITMQAWVTQSADLNSALPRMPAGSIQVIGDGQTLDVDLPTTRGLGNVMLGSQVPSGFTHLVIEAYTKEADRGLPQTGDSSVNGDYIRYYTSTALKLP
jgi:hypothetical protein